MGTVLRVVATLLVVSAPVACATAQGGGMSAAAGERGGVHLDAADNGRRVELRTGEVLALDLRANYSTGYSWQVVSSGEPVLRQLGPPTFVEDSDKAGAGGTVTYRFRAEREGTASLELVYVRPWEKNVEPTDRFSLTVVVTEEPARQSE